MTETPKAGLSPLEERKVEPVITDNPNKIEASYRKKAAEQERRAKISADTEKMRTELQTKLYQKLEEIEKIAQWTDEWLLELKMQIIDELDDTNNLPEVEEVFDLAREKVLWWDMEWAKLIIKELLNDPQISTKLLGRDKVDILTNKAKEQLKDKDYLDARKQWGWAVAMYTIGKLVDKAWPIMDKIRWWWDKLTWKDNTDWGVSSGIVYTTSKEEFTKQAEELTEEGNELTDERVLEWVLPSNFKEMPWLYLGTEERDTQLEGKAGTLVNGLSQPSKQKELFWHLTNTFWMSTEQAVAYIYSMSVHPKSKKSSLKSKIPTWPYTEKSVVWTRKGLASWDHIATNSRWFGMKTYSLLTEWKSPSKSSEKNDIAISVSQLVYWSGSTEVPWTLYKNKLISILDNVLVSEPEAQNEARPKANETVERDNDDSEETEV